MKPSHWRHIAATAGLTLVVLAATLGAAQAPLTQASPARLNTHVTVSVFTCCGSLEGFNDADPSHVWSIHNIYAKLWAKQFPGLKWKETLINDQSSLETKLTLAVNAGTPPDMVFIQGNSMGFTVLRHLAQPLDQYYAQAHITDSYFLPAMAHWSHFGGHWWGIPAVSGPLAGQTIYLPKYMAALGYNNSNLKTFADYYNMSKKAVRFDRSGNLTRVGYWPGIAYTWGTTSNGMCALHHGLYNAANQPTATDPCNVAWLTYLKKLVDLYGGYAKLNKFMSGDPTVWSGSPKAYVAQGKALVPQDDMAYWVIPQFDTATFGVKGGVQYQLTPLPPSLHGTLAEAANLPSTQQEIVIPRGARHPDVAFAASKMIVWDNGALMAPTGNGSPVAKDQEAWVHDFIVGEAAKRKANGMAGNPSASLEGVKMLPTLARVSHVSTPINPVDVYYQDQLGKATERVLYGQQSPQAALQRVETLVLAQEQRLKAQYGAWNW